MSEFIREVDEEYRQEKIRTLVSRYWTAVLGLAVLVLIGVGGWRGYVYYRQQQNEAAGVRYFDATQMARDDRAGSLAALDAIAKDAPAGYRLLARFRAAAETGQGDAAAGAKAFDGLADDQSLGPDLRDVARLRAAMLLLNTAEPADIRKRLEPLADANAPFRNIAREMLAVTALKQGDDAAAKPWLDATVTDPVAAQDQRQRASLFLGLIQSGKPGTATPGSSAPAPDAVPAPPAIVTPEPDAAATPPAIAEPAPNAAATPPDAGAPAPDGAATPPATPTEPAAAPNP